MTDQDLCFLPATLLVQMIRAKQVSPVEVMQAIINRVERLEPKINAFAYFDGDRALDRAKAAQVQLARGEAQGALFGLPVTIKDLAVTGDMPTERGSWIEKGNQPDTDAPFVQRLKICLLYTSPSPRD